MEIFDLGKIPDGLEYYEGYGISDLQEYDLEALEGDNKPDAIFYWYATGSYEGTGRLIAVKNGKWDADDLSHCSCYGPMGDDGQINYKYPYNSLDELLGGGTKEYASGYEELVELAKSKGYK